MTITAGTYVQSSVVTTHTDGDSATVTFTPAAGDMAVVGVTIVDAAEGNYVRSITDTHGAIWEMIERTIDASNGGAVELWWGRAGTAGATTVTVTMAGTSEAWQFNLQPFTNSNTATLWEIDSANFLIGSSSSGTPYPPLAPTGTGELYVGWMDVSGTDVAGTTAGFTYRAANSIGDTLCFNTNVSGAVSPKSGTTGTMTYQSLGVLFKVHTSQPAVMLQGAMDFNPTIFAPATTSGTISITPEVVGSVYILQVVTALATSVSGGGIAWSRLVENVPGPDDFWYGVVPSGHTGAQTVTVSGVSNAGDTNWGLAGMEYSTVSGHTWTVDTTGTTESGTGTTVTWPDLTTAGSGELYWGFLSASGGAALIGTTANVAYYNYPWNVTNYVERGNSAGTQNCIIVSNTALSGSLTPTASQAASGPWDTVGVLLAASSPTVTGSAAVAVPTVTVAATGKRIRVGLAAVTVPGVVVAATGKRIVAGIATVTVGAPVIGAVGVGHRNLTGTAAVAVPTATVVAIGKRTAVGHAAVTTSTAITAAGQRTTHGISAVEVPAVVIAGSGSSRTTVTGSITVAIPQMTVNAIGTRTAIGHASIGTSATIAATGERTATGAAVVAIPTVTISAASAGHHTVTGTIAVTVAPLAIAAMGRRTVHGTTNVAVAVVTVTATGRATGTVQGVATITIGTVMIAGRSGPAHPGLIRVRVTCTYQDVGRNPVTWARPSFRLSQQIADGLSEIIPPTMIGCTLNSSGQLVGPDGDLGVTLVALDELGNGRPVLHDGPVEAVYVITGQPGQTRGNPLRVLASMAPQVDLATIQGAA